MENEIAGWQLGTASIVAAFWIVMWFVGRPLLKILQAIGRFFKRIGGMIQRFLQPIFEFLYRSLYTLLQAASALFLGYVALQPFIGDEGMNLTVAMQAEAGVAALVMVGMSYLVFKHFLKFPLRKGQANSALDAMKDVDSDELETDFEFEI